MTTEHQKKLKFWKWEDEYALAHKTFFPSDALLACWEASRNTVLCEVKEGTLGDEDDNPILSLVRLERKVIKTIRILESMQLRVGGADPEKLQTVIDVIKSMSLRIDMLKDQVDALQSGDMSRVNTIRDVADALDRAPRHYRVGDCAELVRQMAADAIASSLK